MEVSFIINSIFKSITYILPVGNQKDCYLVDCGDVEKVIEKGFYVRGVLLTHAHTDHIYGLNRLMEVFPLAYVYTNVEGNYGLQNPKWNFSRYHEDIEDFVFSRPENVRILDEGCSLDISGLNVKVLSTPGHEPSCLSYIIGNNLFTGDAYIPGIKVVTNFPRSDKLLAQESLSRLQILESSGLKIMPGHWRDGLFNSEGRF